MVRHAGLHLPLREMVVPRIRGTHGKWYQNTFRYAYFAQKQHLVINLERCIAVYDTQAHQINGVSQQQQDDKQTVTFGSQKGNLVWNAL